jgi:hypothetical protein
MRKWGKHKQITTMRGPAYNSGARRRNSIQIYHMISIEVPKIEKLNPRKQASLLNPWNTFTLDLRNFRHQ